jgi:hypothetical protein
MGGTNLSFRGLRGPHIAVGSLEDHTKSVVLFKSTIDHDDVIGEKVWKRGDVCHIESDRIYSILRKSPFYNVLDDRICRFWVHIANRSLDDRSKSLFFN